MKNILNKIYLTLTAPIYKRLSKDLALQMQTISLAYIQQHENMTSKMLDELTGLSLRVERLEALLLAEECTVKNHLITSESNITNEYA